MQPFAVMAIFNSKNLVLCTFPLFLQNQNLRSTGEKAITVCEFWLANSGQIERVDVLFSKIEVALSLFQCAPSVCERFNGV